MIPLVTGTQIAFWIAGPLSVVLGLGVVLLRRMVHSALCLAGVMIALGVLYASLDAPFLFVAQIIVYTGSVMMVFVFAMMLIGIDTAEDLRETIKGHRVLALIAALGTVALIIGAVVHGFTGTANGLDVANGVDGGNAQGIATLLFGRYVIAFEATAALVITAALGAMVLAHRERLVPKLTQRSFAAARMQAYATTGTHPGARPSSGVYARHNSIEYPALLPDGSIAAASVSTTLDARGQSVLDPRQLTRPVIEAHNELMEARSELTGEPFAPLEMPPAAPSLERGAAASRGAPNEPEPDAAPAEPDAAPAETDAAPAETDVTPDEDGEAR